MHPHDILLSSIAHFAHFAPVLLTTIVDAIQLQKTYSVFARSFSPGSPASQIITHLPLSPPMTVQEDLNIVGTKEEQTKQVLASLGSASPPSESETPFMSEQIQPVLNNTRKSEDLKTKKKRVMKIL